ncbi:MAG: prepilin-type N-terminal cleavage/methylation domain-containing protein [Verrucomicrobiota bacterium]
MTRPCLPSADRCVGPAIVRRALATGSAHTAPPRPEAAFTLVEVMIAMTIFALVIDCDLLGWARHPARGEGWGWLLPLKRNGPGGRPSHA